MLELLITFYWWDLLSRENMTRQMKSEYVPGFILLSTFWCVEPERGEGKRQRRQGTTEIVDVRAVRKNRNELSFRAEKREGNMWRGGVKKWKIYFFKGWLQRRLESSKGTRTL